jgi:predicted MFS family arabinose efflux permease
MAEEFTHRALLMAVGTYIGANSLGGITGRVYGGFVSEHWGWESAVAGMALFSFICALVVYSLLPKARYFKPQPKASIRSVIRIINQHMTNPALSLAMIIGGLNFALFVNLYTVMGFRLVAEPFSLPIGWASLIFLCYLTGTLSAKFSGHWHKMYSATQGILLGSLISALGAWIAAIDSLYTIIPGLMLISSGAFFTHSLAYGWVSHQAKSAKATATALYLVHYYLGGSLGGFLLIACWERGAWLGVLLGSMMLYGMIYSLCFKMKKYDSRHHKPDIAAS